MHFGESPCIYPDVHCGIYLIASYHTELQHRAPKMHVHTPVQEMPFGVLIY